MSAGLAAGGPGPQAGAPVYILGGYYTDFARNFGREGKSLIELLRETLHGVLAAAELEPAALQTAHIGRFKPLCDFDWSWPKRCDRAAIEALMALDFLREAGNAVLVGPNGVGKSTLAQNIAHQALIAGHTVLFTTAGALLGDLAALDSDTALRRRLRHYARPSLLVIDEVGYLSYSNRHADLMFELVSRRYQAKSTIITTNRPFAEWHQVFPAAACVVSLIDRLVHNAEIIAIEADSYRLKEAQERSELRARRRRANKA